MCICPIKSWGLPHKSQKVFLSATVSRTRLTGRQRCISWSMWKKSPTGGNQFVSYLGDEADYKENFNRMSFQNSCARNLWFRYWFFEVLSFFCELCDEKVLLNYGSDVGAIDSNGTTILMYAVTSRETEIASKILEELEARSIKEKIMNVGNKEGCTVVHFAVVESQCSMIKVSWSHNIKQRIVIEINQRIVTNIHHPNMISWGRILNVSEKTVINIR